MKKFSKGLFAFLAIAFVMGLSAMVVSAKEVALSPENFPDENIRKALEEKNNFIKETEMVWDEDDEEWYEQTVYEENEVWDENYEDWVKVPVYKKDANGYYLMDTDNFWFKYLTVSDVKDFTGIELLDNLNELTLRGNNDLSTIPNQVAERITRISVYNSTEEVLDLSLFTKLNELCCEGIRNVSKIILNSNIENVQIYGAPNLTKIDIPKNNRLKGLTLRNCKKIKKFDLKNYKKLTYFGEDGSIALKNIPSKLKNIGVPSRKNIKVSSILGKGYKQKGKMTDVEYNAKKGTYKFEYSQATFVKGNKKITIRGGEPD